MKARDRFSARQPSQGASSPLGTGSRNSRLSSRSAPSPGSADTCRAAAPRCAPSGPPPAASCCRVPPTSRASSPWRRPAGRHHLPHRLGADAHQPRSWRSPARPSDRVRPSARSPARSCWQVRGCRSPCSMHRLPCRSDSPCRRAGHTDDSGSAPSRNSTSPAPASARSPVGGDTAPATSPSSWSKPGTVRSIVSIDCIASLASPTRCSGYMRPRRGDCQRSILELVGQSDAGAVRGSRPCRWRTPRRRPSSPPASGPWRCRPGRLPACRPDALCRAPR